MNISFNYQNNAYYKSTPYNQSMYGSPGPASNSTDTAKDINKIDAKSVSGKVECETCKNRKYVDGSDDPGVSFKTPAHIDPQNAASAVLSHEREHVRNESAKAAAENHEVVSQNIKLETSSCPECGKVYVSGGTTTTVTKTNSNKSDYFKSNFEKKMSGFFGKTIDLKV